MARKKFSKPQANETSINVHTISTSPSSSSSSSDSTPEEEESQSQPTKGSGKRKNEKKKVQSKKKKSKPSTAQQLDALTQTLAHLTEKVENQNRVLYESALRSTLMGGNNSQTEAFQGSGTVNTVDPSLAPTVGAGLSSTDPVMTQAALTIGDLKYFYPGWP